MVLPGFLHVSPFGPYCKECNMTLALEKGIHAHGKTSHPEFSFKNATVVREVKAKMVDLRVHHRDDFTPFLVPGSKGKDMWFCTGCFVAYGKYFNYKRHFDSRCNKDCVYVDDAKACCYDTVCGRLGPKSLLPLPPPGPVLTPTLISDSTTISSLTQSKCLNDVLSRENKVPAALMTTLEEAKEILKPFVRPDEDVNDLCLLFYPLLSPAFEGNIRQYLNISTKQQSEDPILVKWLQAGQLWMTKYASGHIANVSANVRHRLAEFDQQEVDGTIYGTRTFTLRRNIPRVVGELDAVLRFFYRFPTTLFDQFKTEEVKNADLNWMIERAIIPRILFVAAKEEPTDHGQLPVACRYCLSRGFTIKDQSQLVMYECGWFSSRISALLHLLRAGVCGYLITLSVEDGTHDLTSVELELVRLVQNGRVTNLLSPYIKRLRDLNARKPRVKDNTVNANGDITSGPFIFPKTVWTTLIPRVTNLAKTCFMQIFEGDSWENFLILPLHVADLNKLDVSVEKDGINICLNDLSLKENVESLLAMLQSIGEFCLFGFGVGAVRHEEVVRLKSLSFQWHNSYLYYYTESLKQGSLRGDKMPRLVEHRLSLTLSRLFLLLRYSFVASGVVAPDAFMPDLPGASMLALVRDLFDFDYTPHMLNVRHFFTSVGNILLPEKNLDGFEGTFVSDTCLTEKSGHTQGTGRRSYGTYLENSEEMLYDLYHESLGEVSLKPPVVTFTPYSDSILSAALKELFGAEAQFRSRQQKLMVEVAANSVTRHSYVGIPCGHGKSLSWFVPVMASYLAGRQVGLRIVILPYKFLLGHMVQHARSLFGLLSDTLRVEFLTSTDMDDQSVPAMLQADGIPSILFVNLDGAATLLRLHLTRLQKLASSKTLKRIYVDEFQQLVIEFGFRSAYQSLRDLGRVGVPVMCLSGSMPLPVAESLMSYCRLTIGVQIRSIDTIQGCDPIGDGFTFDVQIVENIASAIVDFVLKSNDTACHVICNTKGLVDKVVKKLSSFRNVLSVTGDTPSVDQIRCAEQWSKGLHDVLVSTVVALVGNENRKCTKILIGGFLYNISSLVQAIGRLRPDQRGSGAAVIVFHSSTDSKFAEITKEAERDNFSELLTAGCLSESLREDYSIIFSATGLERLLSLKVGCYLQTLSAFYGYSRTKCGICGLCSKLPSETVSSGCIGTNTTVARIPLNETKRKSPGILSPIGDFALKVKRPKDADVNTVLVVKSSSTDEAAVERKIRRLAERVFHELLYRCIVCGKAYCIGECDPGCYRCGNKNHQSSGCEYDSKGLTKILSNKGVCFGCFDTQMRGVEGHDQRKCPMKRRLKRLLFLDRLKTSESFDAYLRRVYTDEMSFLRKVASFAGKVSLGRTVDRRLRQLKVLSCSQVAHDSETAPLLPPDVIHRTKDLSVDGLVRSVTFDDVGVARAKYKILSKRKASIRRRRKYVYGSMYKKLFDGYLEIDPLEGDVDLQVDCRPDVTSILQIRLVSPTDGLGKDNLLRSGVALGRALGVRGNARGSKVGDVGSMHALGYRCAAKKELYVMEDDIKRKIENVSRPMRDWMEDHMPEALKDMIDADRRSGVAYTLSCMPTGPGSRMMVSVNLANAAHYDVNDTSFSVAMWLEERPGVATNWFFVLPNLSYEGSSGIAVKLCHGTVISWDAREIFHCTSKTKVGEDNRVFGCMWGASN